MTAQERRTGTAIAVRIVTVGELPDLRAAPFPRPVLKCPECGGEQSAHRLDYTWCLPEGQPLVCVDDGAPLQLVPAPGAPTWTPLQLDRRH